MAKEIKFDQESRLKLRNGVNVPLLGRPAGERVGPNGVDEIEDEHSPANLGARDPHVRRIVHLSNIGNGFLACPFGQYL